MVSSISKFFENSRAITAQVKSGVFGKLGALYLRGQLLRTYAEAFGFNRTISYEIPVAPEVMIKTDIESIHGCSTKIINYLEECEDIPCSAYCHFSDYYEEEYQLWRRRLAKLGFCKG